MRLRARVDRNQPSIVAALRSRGCSVAILSAVGKGIPDILVGRDGRNYLIEIKDGDKPPSARKLTPDEKDFHAGWSGHVAVAATIEEALEIVGATATKIETEGEGGR